MEPRGSLPIFIYTIVYHQCLTPVEHHSPPPKQKKNHTTQLHGTCATWVKTLSDGQRQEQVLVWHSPLGIIPQGWCLHDRDMNPIRRVENKRPEKQHETYSLQLVSYELVWDHWAWSVNGCQNRCVQSHYTTWDVHNRWWRRHQTKGFWYLFVFGHDMNTHAISIRGCSKAQITQTSNKRNSKLQTIKMTLKTDRQVHTVQQRIKITQRSKIWHPMPFL